MSGTGVNFGHRDAVPDLAPEPRRDTPTQPEHHMDSSADRPVGLPSDPNTHAGRLERWLADARAEIENLRCTVEADERAMAELAAEVERLRAVASAVRDLHDRLARERPYSLGSGYVTMLRDALNAEPVCDPWGLPCPEHGDQHWRDALTEAQAEVARLRLSLHAVSTYQVEHRNMGECPEWSGDESRDPACPVCNLLTRPAGGEG